MHILVYTNCGSYFVHSGCWNFFPQKRREEKLLIFLLLVCLQRMESLPFMLEVYAEPFVRSHSDLLCVSLGQPNQALKGIVLRLVQSHC